MPASSITPGTFAEAVRAWCAAHPLSRPDRRRRCPACGHAGCFDLLPSTSGDVARWACFSVSHDRVGRPGNGCWVGDALDLESHRRGVTPAEVLRADGFLSRDLSPCPLEAPARVRKVPEDPHAAWATLNPSTHDTVDLVRYNSQGRAHVRAWDRSGRPIRVCTLGVLPAGWYGATPRAACDLLRDRKPGRWATPDQLLAGEVTPDDDLVIAVRTQFSEDVARVLAVLSPCGGSHA